MIEPFKFSIGLVVRKVRYSSQVSPKPCTVSIASSVAQGSVHAGVQFVRQMLDRVAPFVLLAALHLCRGTKPINDDSAQGRVQWRIKLDRLTDEQHSFESRERLGLTVREPLEKVALLEGLTKHADSVNVRFKS